MTTPFIDLLQQIASGIVIFEPFKRSPLEIQQFQDTVYRLLEMERLGLIMRTFTQKREIAGVEYCDLVMVQGGLTIEGRRLLEEHQEVEQS